MLGGMWYRVFQNNQRVRKECPEAGCVGGSIMVILEIWSSGRCGQHCMYTSINRNISNESIDEDQEAKLHLYSLRMSNPSRDSQIHFS